MKSKLSEMFSFRQTLSSARLLTRKQSLIFSKIMPPILRG